jgi:chromosome partitioning protein
VVALKVVATYSIKGGVGKTTAAVNLAYEATRAGVRVLLWDLDPQGAATFFLRVKPTVKGGAERMVSTKGDLAPHVRATDFRSLHVVPADFSLRHLDLHLDETKHPTRRLGALLGPLADQYDLALLDCPPSISLSSESVFGAADALLVPTIPTTLSARTLTPLVDFLADWSDPPKLLPFLSMVDRRKKLQVELVQSLTEAWPNLLPTAIPNSSVAERMGVERAPVGAFAPNTAVARAFRGLWSDVSARLWN